MKNAKQDQRGKIFMYITTIMPRLPAMNTGIYNKAPQASWRMRREGLLFFVSGDGIT
ncbi:hypothetical protein [Desulfobulbus elongatus]|uniref:hypothetical protein n=1 Tax=Desulfobulbus elongatus TaxID=53332 RepID=UPI001B8053EB|nr:hypothetical protein [Desulfobulbus elongatus]